MLELVPITEAIGTEVRGIDVTEELAARDFDRIYQAWIDTTILLFRGQRMSQDQHVAFTRRFGQLVSYTRSEFNTDTNPEILVLSNIARDGKLIGSPVSGRVWHSDGHYLTDPPAGSMLYALQVPPVGGDTQFANMAAAYDALPPPTKDLVADLRVVISRVQSRPYNYPDRPPVTAEQRAEWADVSHPVVRVHEVSGRRTIYAGGNVPWHVEGMPPERSAPLVTFLQEFAVRPRFTYRHRWRAGDIVLWDNRSAMHCASWYDGERYHRHMHRTTIAGGSMPPGVWPARAGELADAVPGSP